jgi:hypothetical protein
MYILQDVVDLIIDQLASMISSLEHRRYLQATSLVSTPWVNPSQRHLFSTIDFFNCLSVRRWCSRIKPDPYGVSRHVRVLRLRSGPLSSSILMTALPHLTSLQNLQELDMSPTSYTVDMININHASLNILVPVFSSLAGALKRLRWIQTNTTQETWRNLYILTNLLPNLMDLNLSTFHGGLTLPPALPRIHLSPDGEPPDPSAFEHFKFQELEITDPIPPSSPFLEHCQTHLQVLGFWGGDLEPGYVSGQCRRKVRIKCSDQSHRGFQKPPDVVRGVPCPPGGQLLLPVIHRTGPGLDPQQLCFPHTSILSGGCSGYNLQTLLGSFPSRPLNRA